MARPKNTATRVKELNLTIRALPGSPKKIPRDSWDRIVMQHYKIGPESAQPLTRMGETLGYWRRRKGKVGGTQGGSGVGVIELLG